MTASQSTAKRRNTVRRMAAGLLVVAGFAIASAAPAMADRKHHNNWKHDHGQHHSQHHHGPGPGPCPDEVRYYGEPDVVYVERPVYVRQRVYVEPEPVYYQPAPRVIYQRPSINIVVPLFD